jgi:TP901 family phage tail tape measure protein
MDAISLTGRLNLTVNTAKVEAQLAALGKQAPIKITATLPTAQLRAYREELTRVRKASKEVEDGFSDFAEKAALAGKRFAAFTVATTGFFALASAIKSGISTASDFEVELLRVQQVTRESARNISGLKESIFGVAKGLGVSSKELLSVGLTLGQAGRSIQEIKDSLAPLAKTRLAATFGDITDTVNALIAAQEQFKVTSKDTEQVLGSINVLSAKYAVEAQDLTTAIQKAGGAFSSFADSAAEPKKNLNELLALFTAVRSTTRESADTIATGFRTIFARLRNPKNISALEAFGINLKDDKGLLLKPLEQIRAISRAVKDLDKRDIRFSQIIEEVGGIRQQSKVIPLLEQMEKAEQALVTATQGANSLTRDAQIAQESLANQLAKTREEFLKLINDGFGSEEFKTFAKTALGIASALIKVGEAIGPLLPAFATLAATKFLLPDAAGQLSGYQKVSTAVKNQFGPHKKFASGGPVGGSGSGDKVPAMLEPGEFVVPKHAASKVGHDFLEKVRKGEKPKGYALGGLVGKIRDNPTQSALTGVVLGSIFEHLNGADDAVGRFGKAVTTASTQFFLLNSILGTFGRTAKQTRILEEESQAYIENEDTINKREDAISSAKAVKSDLSEVASSRDAINSGIGYQQGKLSDITTELEKNRITPKRREDLVKVRALQRVNEKLSNNPNDQTEVKNYLAKRIKNEDLNKATNTRLIKKNEDELKTLSNPDAIQKKKDRIAELKAARSGAISRKQYFEEKLKEVKVNTANPAGVKSQVTSNQKEIDKILKSDPDILQSATIIASLQSQKRDVQDKIRKLKKSRKQSTDNFIKLEAQYKELVKTEEELKQQLVTPAQKKQFKESFDLQNNKSVTGSLFGIKFKRRTKADLERDAKRESVIAGTSAVAAGVGGLVSSFGQDNLKNTPDSGVGRGLAAAGSAATLGAEFAAIGTTIHPVVGILGGLGGALWGFKKSLDETGNAIQDIAIDKNLTEFAKLVELVNDKEKRGGIGTNIKNASNLVTDTQNRVLSTGTKESRDKAENLAANAQNLLRGFAQTIGENNGTLKKFNEEGKTLIEFVSRFSNTSLKELDSQFKKIIEDSSKLSKANKQQVAISEREQTRGILSTGILGAFEDVSASLNEFDAVLNGGISDLSSVFKRIGQISDSQLLDRANKQAGSVLGRVEGGADFLKENQLINEIGRELPTLLVEAFRNTKNPLEGQGPVETLSAALSERFKLPEQSSIKDSIVGQLIEATKNKSSSEIADLIQSNLKSGLVDPILSNLVKIGDVSTQAVQLRNQELKFLEGIYSRIGELNTNIRESQLGVVDLEEKRQTGLSPSNDIGLQRKLGFESQRLSIISGRSDNNVGSLAGVLGRARGRLKSIDEEKQSGEKDGLNDLAKRRSVELETISRVTKALDYLGKSATKLSNIEESISKEKSLRDTKVGILKQYAFGSPDQKRESSQNLQIAQKLLETQDIRSVPGNLLQGGVGILEQFKDASYGGQKIDDIITKLAIQGGGLSGDLASQLGITKGKSEKDLEKERDNAIIVAQEALVASQNDLKSQTENLTSAINTQFPSFIENLTKLLLGNRETDLSIKFAQTKGKLDDVSAKREKMLALSSSLKGTGLNNLGSRDIGVLNSVVPELINKNKAKLGNDKLKNFSGIQGLNNLSGKGVIRKLESSRKELEDVYGNKITNDIISEIESGIGSVDIFEGKQGFANKVFGKYKNQAISQNNKTIKESDSNIGRQLDSSQQDSLEKNFHGEWGIRKLFEELDGLRGGNLQYITKQFNELTRSLEGIKVPLSNITASLGINSNIAQQVSKLNLTGVSGFATGGGVPGLGNFDSVPAMLTPGEFVIRKSAAEALGPEVLNQLNGYNKGGRVKFDGGGPVQLQDTLKRRQESENERREQELANKANKEAAMLSRRFGNDKEYNSLWDKADSEKEKHNTEVERRFHDFSPKFEPVKPHGMNIRTPEETVTVLSESPINTEKTKVNPFQQFLDSRGGGPQKKGMSDLARGRARAQFHKEIAEARKQKAGGAFDNPEMSQRNNENGVNAYLMMEEKNNKSNAKSSAVWYGHDQSDKAKKSQLAMGRKSSGTYIPKPAQTKAESDVARAEVLARRRPDLAYANRPNQRNSYEQFKGKQTDLSLGIPGQKGVNRPDFNNAQFPKNSMSLVEAEKKSLSRYKSYSNKPYEFPNTPIRRAAGGGTGPSTISGASRGITCELNTESLEKFNKAISEFSKPADKLAIALEKFPKEFTMAGEHNVHVMVTGADALASLEDTFGKLVEAKIKKAINDTTDRLFNGSVGRMV